MYLKKNKQNLLETEGKSDIKRRRTCCKDRKKNRFIPRTRKIIILFKEEK